MSGMRYWSDSAMRVKPSIELPSNHVPWRTEPSIWWSGIVTALTMPRMSVNWSWTNRTPSDLAFSIFSMPSTASRAITTDAASAARPVGTRADLAPRRRTLRTARGPVLDRGSIAPEPAPEPEGRAPRGRQRTPGAWPTTRATAPGRRRRGAARTRPRSRRTGRSARRCAPLRPGRRAPIPAAAAGRT